MRPLTLRDALGGATLVWLLTVASLSAAVTVHTWVDAEGVRHFADKPPAGDDAGAQASEITVDVGDALAPGDADYYSISNQWQRLRAEREAQNAADLERRRIDAAQSEPAPPPAQEQAHSVYYPNYYALPPRFGPLYPQPSASRGPPSPRNAFVNTPPPVWPRER